MEPEEGSQPGTGVPSQTDGGAAGQEDPRPIPPGGLPPPPPPPAAQQATSSGQPAAPGPSSLATSSSIMEAEAEAAKKPPPLQPMLRPKQGGTGKDGRRINVLANFYDVRIREPAPKVVLYNVDFGRDLTLRTLTRLYMQSLFQHNPQVFADARLAYDGRKSLFSIGNLPFEVRADFNVVLQEAYAERPRGGQQRGPQGGGGRERQRGGEEEERAGVRQRVRREREEMAITLTKAGEIDMAGIKTFIDGHQWGAASSATAQEGLRVLDVVLREFGARRFRLIKDSFFDDRFGRPFSLGGGVAAWSGLNVSFKPTRSGVCLNLDIVMAAFSEPRDVTDLLREMSRDRGRIPPRLDDRQRIELRKILKDVTIETTHLGEKNRSHKVKDVTREGASSLTFSLNRRGPDGEPLEPEQITVADYFARCYQPLQHPDLPCLDVGKGRKINWLPLECCRITPGQPYLRKLSGHQISTLARNRMRADQRCKSLQGAVRNAELAGDSFLESWGIRVLPEMKKINARLLPAPTLVVGKQKTIQPRDGQWNLNNEEVISGATIKTWAVVALRSACDEREAGSTAMKLAQCCQRKGMTIGEPTEVLVVDDRRGSPSEVIDGAVKQLWNLGPKFVLFILDRQKNSAFYAPIKKVFDQRLCVPTQCIVRPQKGYNDQYFTNIALKMNIKASPASSDTSSPFRYGHANWLLQSEVNKTLLASEATMIFGLDVSHPGGFSKSPSIAAVVASMDFPHTSRYSCRYRLQDFREETIRGLYGEEPGKPGMVEELILEFGEKQGRGPKHIVIYRDGISETQFPAIAGIELHAFRQAFANVEKKVGQKYRPLVTYIVAQKRNNVRLFEESQRGISNVQPGTVVDTDITHPFFFDFFLAAHKGIIGSSRPVHYHVLHDENGFSADLIQQLTHSLSYTYGRCTRSVSVVAPVFYADLLARRVRVFLEGEINDSDSEASAGRGRDPNERVVFPALPKIKNGYLGSMFFC